MSALNFSGTWKLVSYDYQSEDGQVRFPFSTDTSGVIMYDANGYMSVQIIRNDRPPFAENDMFAGTDSEVRQAFEGINTYFGPYEVDEEAGIVRHHIEGSSMPNRIGSIQVRHYTFEGNRLILRAVPRLLKGEMLTGVLIWERI